MSQARGPGSGVDIADCNVSLAPEYSYLGRRFQLELDFRVGGGESVQAGHQPPCREGGLDRNPQAPHWNTTHGFHGPLNPQKPTGQLSRKQPTRLGQFHRPMETAKQLAPDVLFQAAYVATYRR